MRRWASYADTLERLAPDAEIAVAMGWSAGDWRSTPQALVAAYAAVGSASTWEEAHALAVAAGADDEDAGLLADALVVSLSPNATREVWVSLASDLCGEVGEPASEAVLWVTDADTAVDARLGIRIAALACGEAIYAAGPARRYLAAESLHNLHLSTRPKAALAAVLAPDGFEHRDRWYGWHPARRSTPRWSRRWSTVCLHPMASVM